jgi:hypothetical protein
MLTARAAKSASTVNEMSDWSILSKVAYRASTNIGRRKGGASNQTPSDEV